jgi:hypothetical protein
MTVGSSQAPLHSKYLPLHYLSQSLLFTNPYVSLRTDVVEERCRRRGSDISRLTVFNRQRCLPGLLDSRYLGLLFPNPSSYSNKMMEIPTHLVKPINILSLIPWNRGSTANESPVPSSNGGANTAVPPNLEVDEGCFRQDV